MINNAMFSSPFINLEPDRVRRLDPSGCGFGEGGDEIPFGLHELSSAMASSYLGGGLLSRMVDSSFKLVPGII
jgi:hypothetical protein